jgi:hypothetical protein
MSNHDELDADSVRAIFNERPALEERLAHIHSHCDCTSESGNMHAYYGIISAVHSRLQVRVLGQY